MASWADQSTAPVRCEWGPAAVEAVTAEVVVVIDVLRFTTAVDAAVGHGLTVHPYRWRDETAAPFAASVEAVLADGSPGAPSLSPGSLLALDAGTSVVLPSPNGSTCAVLAAEAGATVVAACLRNARAVAAWVGERSVLVVPCGERWPDGSLRPALEDLLGAGAVISALPGARTPEAEAAAAIWSASAADVEAVLAGCASGRQQVARGWADDLVFASQVDVSGCVPVLTDGRFVDAAGS
jgi:2-phosphosulfolactate phosphatase